MLSPLNSVLSRKIAVVVMALVVVLTPALTDTVSATTEVYASGSGFDYPLCKNTDGSWKNIDQFELQAVTGLTYKRADGTTIAPGKYFARDFPLIDGVSDYAYQELRVYLAVATGYSLTPGSYQKDEIGFYVAMRFDDNSYGDSCASYEPKPEINYPLKAKKPVRVGNTITIPLTTEEYPAYYSRRDSGWHEVSGGGLRGGQRLTLHPGRTLYICAETDSAYGFETSNGLWTDQKCWKFSRKADFSMPRGKANARKATVSLPLRLPGAGKVRVAGSSGKVKVVTKRVGSSGKVTVKVKPATKTLKKLKKQLRHQKVARTKIRIKVTYYPKSGSSQTAYKTYTFTLKRA